MLPCADSEYSSRRCSRPNLRRLHCRIASGGRQWARMQVLPHPVGGGFIPCLIRLGGKRTTASRFFCEGGGVGWQLRWTTAERGGREAECDGSASTKLGGGMTGTALTMLTTGITTSHLFMHRRELRRQGGGFAVDGHGRRRGGSGPHPGKEGVG
jgi:hypothetical protein